MTIENVNLATQGQVFNSPASAYNAMGMLHLVRGRFDEAREAYRNAIRLDSLNGSAHDGLANMSQETTPRGQLGTGSSGRFWPKPAARMLNC